LQDSTASSHLSAAALGHHRAAPIGHQAAIAVTVAIAIAIGHARTNSSVSRSTRAGSAMSAVC